MKKLILMLAVLCMAGVMTADTWLSGPSIDTYLDSATDENYGAATVLKSGTVGGQETYRALIRFYPPVVEKGVDLLNAKVESATLTIPVLSHTGGDTEYYVVSYVQTWQEGTKDGDAPADGATASTYDGTNVWTGFFGFKASTVRVESPTIDLFPATHPYVETFKKYSDVFGGASRVVIQVEVEKGDIFNSETLHKVRRITKGLELLEVFLL